MIATGFLALGSHDLVEQNPAVFRMDVVDEQINATSRAFMGVTVGCARCHDHKFDPIPTTDYYAMAGIFKSTEMLSGLQRRPRDNASYFSTTLLAKLTHGPDETARIPARPRRTRRIRRAASADHRAATRIRGGRWPSWASASPAGRRESDAGRPEGAPDREPDSWLNSTASRCLQTSSMAVRDGANPADCEVHIQGEVKDLGPTVPRGFPQVMSAPGEPAKIDAARKRPPRTGPVAHAPRQSHHRARRRQSHLAAPLRTRHRRQRR